MPRALLKCAYLLLVSVVLPASVGAQNLDARLRDAAQNGRVEDVRALLGQGAQIDAADRNGRTALMLAADRGHVSVIQVLLESEASLALKDRNGRTARTLALEKRYAEVVTLLDNAREQIAQERAVERLANYTEGVTTHDQVLRDFPESEYADRELALLYSGQYTAGANADEVLAKSKTAPDFGIVRLGYYKGRGPNTYSTSPKQFVVLRALHFRSGVLVPASEVPSPAELSVFSSTNITEGRVVQIGGKVFSLGGTVSSTSRPVNADGVVDKTRPDLVRHEELEIQTPLFIGQ